jgi:hypothetical protein
VGRSLYFSLLSSVDFLLDLLILVSCFICVLKTLYSMHDYQSLYYQLHALDLCDVFLLMSEDGRCRVFLLMSAHREGRYPVSLCICHLLTFYLYFEIVFSGLQNQTPLPDTSFGSNGNGSGNGSGSGSVFHPSFFMGLLSEGSSPKGTKAYSEKDLGSSMELIIKGDFFNFCFNVYF